MSRIVAILLLAPAALSTIGGLFLLCLAPLASIHALQSGDEDVAPMILVAYGGLGVSLLLPALVQLVAGYRVWQGRGWLLALVAALLGLFSSVLCCNTVTFGCSLGALVLLFSEAVRDELRSDAQRSDALPR